MKLKAFLQKWILNNIGYKILAIAFAFILWLVVLNIQDPEINKTLVIPVEILNEDMLPESEYVYSVAQGDTCTIVVRGKTSIIQSLKVSDFEATADFQELSITNSVPIKVSLKGYSTSTVVITQKTMSMILSLDDIVTKQMPLEIKYVGSVEADMILDSVSVSPEEITVTAPSTVAEKLSKAVITINAEDIDDGVALRATPVVYNLGGGVVEESEDVTIGGGEAVVTFEVSRIKEVELLAVTTTGSPATGYEVGTITTSFSTVKLKGKKEALDKITRVRIPASYVDIGGANQDVSVAVDLTELLPDGVEIYDNNVNVVVTVNINKKQVEETTEPESETETETAEENK